MQRQDWFEVGGRRHQDLPNAAISAALGGDVRRDHQRLVAAFLALVQIVKLSFEADNRGLSLSSHYQFAPNTAYPTGMKMTNWREGDQLVGQEWGQKTLQVLQVPFMPS